MVMKKKIIAFLIIFTLGFGTCYAIFIYPGWYKNGFSAITALTVTDGKCAPIVTEIEKYDWDVKVATAVMKAESKCETEAKGDTDLVYEENGREYGYSVGAFQVRILTGREECDSFDVETNVRCAYGIYTNKGRNFTDWSMYLNGKYKEYLGE